MAQLSGSEPISAANLASVLGSGAVGGQTVAVANSDGTMGSFWVVGCGDADSVVLEAVTLSVEGGAQKRYGHSLTSPLTSGNHLVFLDDETTFSVKVTVYDGCRLVSVSGAQCTFVRAYVVRGGGQLLADILAALEGVA